MKRGFKSEALREAIANDPNAASSLRAYDEPPVPANPLNQEVSSIPVSENLRSETSVHDRGMIKPPAVGGHRSQGIHVYGSDDDIVDKLDATVRRDRRVLGIRQKTGYSLFVRAGLRALDDILTNDPKAFRSYLAQALKERV